MRAWLLAVVVGFACVAACGDDGLPSPPAIASAGPVSIETSTLTLTIGEQSIAQFLSIGTVDEIDETRYYDPRGDSRVELAPIERATGIDGEWLVLDGGTRLRLTAHELPMLANVSCAVLEIDASQHRDAVQLQIGLPHVAGEPAYGTGDAPLRANVAGTVRELQLRVDVDSESSLNETHVPVPLVLWPRRNAGAFVADDRPGALDIAAASPDRTTATFTLPARGTFTMYLFTAGSPIDLARAYTEACTAKPAVPPRWAFAPQQWRNVWNSSTEVLGDAAEMRSRKIPGSVMWIDNPWQTAYNTFVVDEARLATPAQLIADGAQGYKVVFWSTPYVGTTPATQTDRDEGKAADYFVTDEGGATLDYPWQNGPGALVDFTRDGASNWWRERIARVTAIGAAGFKLDFGEEIVPDIGGTIVTMKLAAGDNSSHHNRYAAGYHEAYLGALPEPDRFLITRAGAWGEQATNPSIWPGDLDSDFSEFGVDNGEGMTNVGGLPSAIARGLSLSMSGYPFYGSDIGGFRDFPTSEALIRWAQYAALGTIMQLGGGGKSHNPWDATLFDAGLDVIYKRYAELHMQLNPLLWTLAIEAGRTGTPVTRPARFVFDCACDDAMFLLGDDILVAPVIVPGATTRDVVLPPGRWIDRSTGRIVDGDGVRSNTVPAPLDALPMWHRVGSLVPMFARVADTLLPATAPGVTSYADPLLGRELRLVYSPGAVASTTLHDGARATATDASIEVVGGSEYSVFTIDVDGRGQTGVFAAPSGVTVDGGNLPTAADVTTCAAPGCWRFDAPMKHLEIRVFAPTGTTRSIVIR